MFLFLIRCWGNFKKSYNIYIKKSLYYYKADRCFWQAYLDVLKEQKISPWNDPGAFKSLFQTFRSVFICGEQHLQIGGVGDTGIAHVGSLLRSGLAGGVNHAELAGLVRNMFPISLISIHASPEEQCKMYLEEKVFGHRKTNRKKLTPEQRQEILNDLGKILGKKIKYPNPALNPLGCHIGEKDKLGYYWIKRLKQK